MKINEKSLKNQGKTLKINAKSIQKKYVYEQTFASRSEAKVCSFIEQITNVSFFLK